ncbi:MAG: hypothetical protein ACRDG6_06160 [Candidatus Limnocylindria bacterium]
MRTHPNLTPSVLARTVMVVALAVVGLAGLPGAAAAAPPIRETAAFSSAVAAHDECTGALCTTTSVFVNSSTAFPSQVCVDIQRYEMPAPGVFIFLGFENGCAPPAEGAFSIDTKTLTGATLASTPVRLETIACDQISCQPTGASRVVNVSAAYSGVGPINTFRGNSKMTFGDCTMYFTGKGSSREATAILTIQGESLDATGFLSTSTQKTKVICH